jgi:hypothetical protein
MVGDELACSSSRLAFWYDLFLEKRQEEKGGREARRRPSNLLEEGKMNRTAFNYTPSKSSQGPSTLMAPRSIGIVGS